VFARVTGTVAQFDKAFHVHIKRVFTNFPNVFTYLLPGHQTLKLPTALRPLLTVVDAFYAHSAPASGTARAARYGPRPKTEAATPGPRNRGTWKRGCHAAKATGAYSYAQVRHSYGIQSLGSGRGASVAILNAGEDAPAPDIAAKARCFHYPAAKVRVLRTDGQTAAFGRGTFEPQEDLALVRGMAPGMRSLTFTKAWAAPALLFLGASQVLAERDRPPVLSISYGWCDRALGRRGLRGHRRPRAGTSQTVTGPGQRAAVLPVRPRPESAVRHRVRQQQVLLQRSWVAGAPGIRPGERARSAEVRQDCQGAAA
jgi:hypothetical protein